jgi:trehalose synthase
MIERVRVAQQHAGELLAGRTVWMVNSTAWGGGVAQLLRTLLPYWKGAGITSGGWCCSVLVSSSG